jgi:nucleotide-binding universal stress UspA family protein
MTVEIAVRAGYPGVLGGLERVGGERTARPVGECSEVNAVEIGPGATTLLRQAAGNACARAASDRSRAKTRPTTKRLCRSRSRGDRDQRPCRGRRLRGIVEPERRSRGLALHLLYALEPAGVIGPLVERTGYTQAQRAAGEQLLIKITGMVRELHPALVITSEVSEVGAAESLVALSESAELVVTGTRGHGGFAGMLLGSVSLKVAAHAQCPAVVVRGEQPGEPLNEIVLGVEPNQAAAPIRFAFETAATFGATLTAVRAWQPYTVYGSFYVAAEDLEARREGEHADLTDQLKAVREDYPDVKVSTDAVCGNPVPILIGAARGSRLLVVGSHHHHAPLSVGAGYVVQGLLAHCPTPVAVVPID